MKILAIETSCDETAISIIEAEESLSITINILSNIIHSQIEVHKEYGGVYPMLAKREHGKNLIPVLKKALVEAGIEKEGSSTNVASVDSILEREEELLGQFKEYVASIEKPAVDAIAVTYGPGLEPALWVGVNFAKALSQVWNLPLIPVNHMEGHILSALLLKKSETEYMIPETTFPMLSLLISGGHTELVLSKDWLDYKVVGETRDDAVGEAFDKVARMLGLPYPGGPEISALSEKFKGDGTITLPRPMLHSGDFDFSFSGLKTAVLTVIKKLGELTEEKKIEIAYEFQEAASEVLVTKTLRAIEEYGAETLVVGGGVSANKRIRERLTEEIDIKLHLPSPAFSTDNALMIALAGYMRFIKKEYGTEDIVATGTLRLDTM